jgi:hypothetical protein
MLSNAFIGTLVLATQLASGVLGGQIPTVNGILGGVKPPSDISYVEDIERIAASTPTPGKLRVTENSGICETTPGVYQASGYGDLTASESIWYVTTYPPYVPRITSSCPLGSGSLRLVKTQPLRR